MALTQDAWPLINADKIRHCACSNAFKGYLLGCRPVERLTPSQLMRRKPFEKAFSQHGCGKTISGFLYLIWQFHPHDPQKLFEEKKNVWSASELFCRPSQELSWVPGSCLPFPPWYIFPKFWRLPSVCFVREWLSRTYPSAPWRLTGLP